MEYLLRRFAEWYCRTYYRYNMEHNFTKNDKYGKIIFFDENGSASALKSIQKLIADNKPVDDNRRYFTLTACVFLKDDYLSAVKIIKKMVTKFWDDPNTPVVFHTRDIQKRLGYFNFSTDEDYEVFISNLSLSICLMKFEIISVTFDLVSYVNQYYKHDPYEVAFDIILETAMFKMKEDEQVALVFEARGKKEDELLNKHIFKTINTFGTQKNRPSILKKHFSDVFFNPKMSEDGSVVYHGIDIADLCSYPIYRYMRFGTVGRDFDIVKEKLAGYKKIKEKDMRMPGLRKFPAEWQK